MPLLLAFGDSNTHGSPPIADRAEARQRYGADTRWASVAAARLGWDVVEEGLPGRTAQYPDPVMGAHMDGRPGLRMALSSHGPIDWLALMLGTNDLKIRFGGTALTVASGLAALLDIARSDEVQMRHGGFRILLICPPPVIETGPFRAEFLGAETTSRRLPELYAALAAAHGCSFLDAGEAIEVSPVDGIHFEAAAQKALGEKVAEVLAGA